MAAKQGAASAPLFQCKSCEGVFEANAFYASNLRNCKECVKAAVRRNRAEKADYYRAYDRKRYRENPERKEHCQEQARKIPMSDRVEKQRERRRAAPEKNRARLAVYRAVKAGKIKRKPCYFCGATKGLHAHHEDYAQPLDVVWLCSSCHGKLHTIKGDFRRAK